MGTYWIIDFGPMAKSYRFEKLESELLLLINQYDQTFSDWSPQSELRKLEKKGLTNWNAPSPLFLKGLTFAQEAYALTNQLFDVTIGAVIWNEMSLAVGLNQLERTKNSFRFLKDPKRLTFGGIVKGMAVGEMAKVLVRKYGFEHFRISAGGGNLALIGHGVLYDWEEISEANQLQKDRIIFLSRSSLTQHKKNHILNPKNTKEKAFHSRIQCYSTIDQINDWDKLSAYSDALSTVRILTQNHLENKVKNCFEIKV